MNEANQQGPIAGAVPCLHGNHPVFLRNDFRVVAHWDGSGDRCPANDTLYPEHIARAFERTERLIERVPSPERLREMANRFHEYVREAGDSVEPWDLVMITEILALADAMEGMRA